MDFSVRKSARPYQVDTVAAPGALPTRYKLGDDALTSEFGFPKRKVHCYQPMAQNGLPTLNAGQPRDGKQGFQTVPSMPMPIPRSSSSSGLLIKAFPAYEEPFQGRKVAEPIDHNRYTSAQALSPPKGSWTERQIQFQPGDVPARLNKSKESPQKVKGDVTAPKVIEAAPKDTLKAKEPNMEHAVWRYRFKKKWIREELHARKQDFPDDPEYEDPWQDAGDFIIKNGYKSAMQAAFMGASRDLPPSDQPLGDIKPSSSDLSFDSTFDEEENASNLDSTVEMLTKAATLIKLTHKSN